MDEPQQKASGKRVNGSGFLAATGLALVIVCAFLVWIFVYPNAGAIDAPAITDTELLLDDSPPIVAELISENMDDSFEGQATHLESRSQGRVLIVRGILTIFSLGMDDLAEKMRAAGYKVEVSTAAQSSNAARRLLEHVLKSPSREPVIIVGHSLGGDLAPKLANIFSEKSIPIDVMFMLDSTMPSSPPRNVRVCVNMYQDNGTPDWARLFRGTSISAQSRQTRMINIDIRKLAGKDTTAGIHHFNIDANPWVHRVMMNIISRVKPQHDISGNHFQIPVKHVDPIPTHPPSWK